MGLISKLFSTPAQPADDSQSSQGSDSDSSSETNFSDSDTELLTAINKQEAAEPIESKLPFDTACPNCGSVLDKPIKRKRECPECKKTIYVRTTQTLYSHSALTKEQLAHSDFYESLRYNLSITKDDYRSTEAQLKKKWNKTKINTYDVLWSLHNNMNLYKRGIGPEYDQRGRLAEVFRKKRWMDIAAATYQARRGHDPKPYLEGSFNNDIQLAKLEDYIDGLTVQCFSCCDACMKFHNKTFSVEFLEKTPVLPLKVCTRPCEDNPKFTFCNCSYSQHYKFE